MGGRFPADPNAAKRLHLTDGLVEPMTTKQTLKVGKQFKQVKGLKGKEEMPNPAVPCLNFVLGAIKHADRVLTVSPGYAKEVVGVLNGVEDIVRPDNAELMGEMAYDKTTLEKKQKAMQKSVGFEVDASIPLFVFLGRLDVQKGVDVMFEAIGQALDGGMKAQFITMGSGIEELEEVAADLDDR